MYQRPIVASVAIFLLSACGGGGGGDSAGMGGRPTVEVPQEPTVTVSLEHKTDNPTAQQVAEYIHSSASGGPWYSGPDFTYRHHPGLARFETPPTLRIAEGTGDHHRAMVHHAVAVINRQLPVEHHVRIGPDSTPFVFIDDIPDGQIFIDFAPPEDWNSRGGGRPGSEADAESSTISEWDPVQQRWEKKERRASRVWMSPETGYSDPLVLSILMHELLHALGYSGHVPADRFPTSLMRDSTSLIVQQIPAIDGAGLRALYTRYANGTEPEDVSVASLGAWASTSTDLFGELDTGDGAIRFGVNDHNGVGVPWIEGTEPDSALADNRALSGTVTWNGELLGFARDNRSVRGDAAIGVDLSTMKGSAEFTELQSWSAGVTPGALGTGAAWGDGTLSYDISVSGNYMRGTGGDDGVLSANFLGANHRGVAGSIERADLTAAFGASR